MARPSKISDSQILSAVGLLQTGAFMSVAAASVGLTGTALLYRMRKLGISGRGSKRLYSGKETELMCGRCKKVFPLAEFTKNRKRSKFHKRPAHYLCKACRLLRYRERIYKLTEAEFKRLWEQQNGKCACCGKGEGEVRKSNSQVLVVDHDHRTKKVRALLCDDCNAGIGYIHERVDSLRGLLNYLNRPVIGKCQPHVSVLSRAINISAYINPADEDLLIDLFIQGAEIKQLIKPSGLCRQELIKVVTPYFKEREWGKRLYTVYGLTVEQFRKIEKRQEGKCAACGRIPKYTKKHRHLFVEHNHITNEIRGLTCCGCNMALSKFHEDPVIIQAAIKYLESHQCG